MKSSQWNVEDSSPDSFEERRDALNKTHTRNSHADSHEETAHGPECRASDQFHLTRERNTRALRASGDGAALYKNKAQCQKRANIQEVVESNKTRLSEPPFPQIGKKRDGSAAACCLRAPSTVPKIISAERDRWSGPREDLQECALALQTIFGCPEIRVVFSEWAEYQSTLT